MLKIDSPIFLQNIIMLSRKLFLLFKKSTTFWDNPRINAHDFYWVFVRTELNLIAFFCSSKCVNTQYAALSGAMG